MIALNYRLLNLDIEIVSRLHEVDLTLNVEKTDKNYRLSAIAPSLDSGINVGPRKFGKKNKRRT